MSIRVVFTDGSEDILARAETFDIDSDGQLHLRDEEGSLFAVVARGQWAYAVVQP